LERERDGAAGKREGKGEGGGWMGRRKGEKGRGLVLFNQFKLLNWN